MFKVELILSTENLWLNPQGEYEGTDPDTHQDHGVVQTIEAATLEELRSKIERQLVSLDKFDAFEGRLEWQCDGEHDYRTPAAEQIPFLETWTLVLSRVETTVLDASQLRKTA